MATGITLLIGGIICFYGICGFSNGFHQEGKWAGGLLISFLMVPLVAPMIEKFIMSSELGKGFISADPTLQTLENLALKIFVFSVSMFITKTIFNVMMDMEIRGFALVVDKIFGAFFAAFKICVCIWGLDILLKVSPIPFFQELRATLLLSQAYDYLATHNLFMRLLL